MNFRYLFASIAMVFISTHVEAAIPQYSAPKYKVNMRVGLKGSAPISVNTAVRSGKKAYISEISDDGQNETVVELYARKSQVNNKKGVYMDVLVTKRIRGQKKFAERAQVFAPENQELEFNMNSKGKTQGSLGLAVLAHEI
ncbi:hypothetical protein D3C87_1633350 [compost metagenome]